MHANPASKANPAPDQASKPAKQNPRTLPPDNQASIDRQGFALASKRQKSKKNPAQNWVSFSGFA